MQDKADMTTFLPKQKTKTGGNNTETTFFPLFSCQIFCSKHTHTCAFLSEYGHPGDESQTQVTVSI